MRVLKIGITAVLVVALLTGIASAVTIPVGKLKVQAIPSTHTGLTTGVFM